MGCHECERLRNQFSAIIEKNRALLADYEAALLSRNSTEIERLRSALLDTKQKRRDSRVALLAHDETHRTSGATAG